MDKNINQTATNQTININTNCPKSSEATGVLFLAPAFLIWGLSPIYWKLLSHVSSIELLFQRVIWSSLFLYAIVLWQGKNDEIKKILKSSSTMMSLAGSTVVLSLNWYLFIWAVNHGQVLQTSLGYYINPLIMVLLGIIFLKERLRKLQIFALFIAGGAVLYYAIGLGQFPWIALTIALSFGFYGLFHKMTSVSSLTGLLVETLILSIPSTIFIVWWQIQGTSALFRVNPSTDLLLVGTNLVTALPLLLFIIGTRRSTMTTVGFMQYLAPSITFLLAVFIYHEPFSHQRLVTFILIWTALAIYSLDSFYAFKKRRVSESSISMD
ncbi:MAG: EamA family transporter RarD [Desulfamplus sp.]|nr:EamA family transporter RarD [Desulfamplus sp.]MBF0413209.1 EamA family transporter RarD [Desulfamplus sp.]